MTTPMPVTVTLPEPGWRMDTSDAVQAVLRGTLTRQAGRDCLPPRADRAARPGGRGAAPAAVDQLDSPAGGAGASHAATDPDPNTQTTDTEARALLSAMEKRMKKQLTPWLMALIVVGAVAGSFAGGWLADHGFWPRPLGFLALLGLVGWSIGPGRKKR